MPNVITPFNYEELAILIRDALRNSSTLSYVDDDAIFVVDEKNKGEFPQFKNYMIRLSAPESGFLIKQPKIGRYFTNNYFVAIELWLKSPQAPGAVSGRLFGGALGGRQQKGIFELLQDVSTVLEHNTFNDQLDAYAGSNIGDPVALSDEEKQRTGIGFLWAGRQNNIS